MNTVAWLAVIAGANKKYAPHGTPETIGFSFWFVIGFVFLLGANRQKRKIRRKLEEEQFDSFLTHEEAI